MAKRYILSRIHNCREAIMQPIIEITGQSRVLIENHQGVLAYSLEKIEIKMFYGKIAITGNNLKVMQMSCDQLVIKGHIDSLHLLGR